MAEPILMLEREARQLGSNRPRAGATTLNTADAVRAAFGQFRRAVWVSFGDKELVHWMVESAQFPTSHRLLLLRGIPRQRWELLRAAFAYVVGTDDGFRLLPLKDVMDILSSERPSDRLIGVAADQEVGAVTVLRGSLEPLVVPVAWFRSPSSPEPDLSDCEVTDWGNTLRMGKYEAATDAILYEFDADFRRLAKARQIEKDDSFGGALKRLRLARRVKRSEFPGVSAKEIARIERGEVERPHGATLKAIAERLRVKPEEIDTY